MNNILKGNIINITEKILSIFFITNIFNLLFILVNSFGKLSIYEDSYVLFNLKNNYFLRFLFETHNGHIIFVSKFINSLFSYLSLPPTGYNISISIFILFLGLFFLRKTIYLINPNSKYNKIFFFLCSYFWISPWQWENLIWEFQIPWFIISLLVIVLTFINFDNEINNKFNNTIIENLFFVISPFIAILSSGQGICYLNCLLISLINKKRSNQLALASTLICYFIFLYIRFTSHNIVEISNNLKDIVLYSFVIIATIFKAPLSAFYKSNYKEWIIPIASSVSFQLYLTYFIGYYYFKKLTFKFNEFNLFVPIIFGLQFIILTSITRSNFGIHQAAVSRYLTCVNLIPIGMILIYSYLNSKTDKINISNKISYRLNSIQFFASIILVCILANTTSVIQTIYQTQIAYNARVENLRIFKESCKVNFKNNEFLIKSNFSKFRTFHGVNIPRLPDAKEFQNFKKYLNSDFCEILNSLD